tara:strand:+ start:22 stop:567 length:546 start_codon:yes stop_codon:yes gene_type:complete
VKKNVLNNHLLIAMPQLNDTIFKQSVILICEDNTEGTMGLIVNKPIDSADDQSKFIINEYTNNKIYFGGPVNLNVCFILHDNSYSLNKTLLVSNDILLTSSKQIIKDIKEGLGPENFKFNMGYAGWDKGQLEKEIKNGDWLLIPNPKNFIFDIPDHEKWDYTANKLGMNFNDAWGAPGGEA